MLDIDSALTERLFQNQLADEREAFQRAAAAKGPGMKAFVSTRSRSRSETVVMAGRDPIWNAIVKCSQGDHVARAWTIVDHYNASPVIEG